jgi:hypothetical protein
MLALRLRAQKALGSVAQAVWYDDSVCHRGELALTAFVARYDQIDPAIELLGGLLRNEDLGDYADVVLLDSGPQGQLTYDTRRRMPLERRPFFPYEISLAAGARYQSQWDATMGLHLGLVWGREANPPCKGGWFWGVGADGRVAFGGAQPRWAAGPSIRLGRAFGALEPYRPGPGTNRGTYVYVQTAAEWSSNGPVVAMSVGFTTLAFGEWVLARYNRTGNQAYPLLLPLALLNHLEVGWELDTASAGNSILNVLLGFSL